MEKQGFVSKVHSKKPHLKPMPRHIQKSNGGKSGSARASSMFGRPDITDRALHSSRVYHPGYDEDQTSQYRLQYATPYLPRK